MIFSFIYHSRVVATELQQRKYTEVLLNMAEELSQNAKPIKTEGNFV
jgi:hypothetical protein